MRLTSPAAGEPGADLLELVQVMARLRAECAWKQEQTHRSLARFLLEEAYETLEAIESGDVDHLREELGDLLLQVYFHAIIATEAGEFTIDDVAAGIVEKMKRRNPHVYGDPENVPDNLDAQSINELWQSIKAEEKQRTSAFEGIPPELPALLYADKVLDRLSREVAPVVPRSGARRPSKRQLSSADVLGERLLDLVAECRAEGVDPEQALRDAVRRLR